jgi:asparagine synthase (glutamine-hydrolysing)
MCGIAGVVYDDAAREASISELRPMTDSIRHRGPDGEGFFTAGGAGLGFRRLSIIDLSTGDQPITSEDETVAVVCNGEIYNYKGLRQGLVSRGHRFKTLSDAEVILHLYEERGPGCVDYLRGMFAFAIWDTAKRSLLLCRDRFGIKPLYYARVKGAFYFGSEQKAVIASNKVERRMNARAITDLFTFGFAHDPHTFFTGIRALPPGHFLVLKNGEAKISKYWEIDYHPSVLKAAGKMSPDAFAEALRDKLSETVKAHMQSDVEIGAWLSPGIDSSAVAALMARHMEGPFKAFSLGFEEKSVDELSKVKTLDCYPGFGNIVRLDAECRNSHFSRLPVALWHKEYAAGGAIDIVRNVLAEHTSRHVKVILTGEGSDELFGGYPWYMANKILKPFARLPLSVRRLVTLIPFVKRTWPGGSRILLAPYEMGLERYARLIERASGEALPDELLSDDVRRECPVEAYDAFRPPGGFDEWHPFNQLLYLDARLRMNSSIVLHLDRQTMAHSLEARVPFLDHELFQLVAGMPPSLKMRRVEEKHILRRAVAGVVPDEIARRKKRSLSAPLGAWMGGKLPAFANELLSERAILDKGYFKPDAIKRLRDANRRGEGASFVLLFMALGVQLWDEIFIRGVSPGDISREV